MAAMESDDNGALSEQILQAYQPAVFVGKHERRHDVAGFRRILAGIMLFKTGDEPVDNRRGGWMKLARGVGEDIKPLGHRAIQRAGLLKSLPEILDQNFRRHFAGFLAATSSVPFISDWLVQTPQISALFR